MQKTENRVTIIFENGHVKQVIDDKKVVPAEKFYSLVGASKEIGVDRTTVFRYIKEGLLSKVMVGKSPKITQSELDRFLNTKK